MNLGIVAPSPVPFTLGGAERAWLGLARAMNESGIRCELLKLPSPERDLAEVVSSYRAFLHLDVSHFDAVLTSKYPAWMVDHPAHDIYLFHRLRGLYDTYPGHLSPRIDARDRRFAHISRLVRGPATRETAIEALDATEDLLAQWSDDPALAHPGPVGRELVHFLDRIGFQPDDDRSYFALSRAVAARPGYFPPGVDVGVVELPSDLDGLEPTGYEHFFTASRLDGPKRLDLLIEAYRTVPGDVPLLIAGTGPDEVRLRQLAAGDDRIQFVGFVGDEELADLYNRALAVPFIPMDEDWGLIAVEAMSAATPVITCTDSGGPQELVDHEHSGFVVEPTVAALATAMTRLVNEPGLAERLGSRALERAQSITWDSVVEGLTSRRTSCARPRQRARPPTSTVSRPSRSRLPSDTWRTGKPKVVVLATFSVFPARYGGPLRAWHLYRDLSSRFDVEFLCLGSSWATSGDRQLQPGLIQRVVYRSDDHQREAQKWAAEVGTDVSDIIAGQLSDNSPDFMTQARRSLADADLVLLAEPYLVEIAEQLAPDVPFIYDSYNCEADLKTELLAGRPRGEELVDRVVDIEGRAVRAAVLRTACSELDAERIGERYGTRPETFLVVPNGVDVASTRFTTGDERRRNNERFLDRYISTGRPPARGVALFVGSYHPPNIDAARRVVRVASDVPDVLFVMCGDHVRALPRMGGPPNVVLAGIVSDLVKSQLLRSATVALNPMTQGSGTNLKLVEYLAAGVPVVSTPFGVRGLPIDHGVHAVLAEPQDFASAVDRAGTHHVDEELDAMAVEGRKLVEEMYDWKQISTVLGDAMEALL